VTRGASFLDTPTYARWGVRTGIATQAFSAAVDVLDKIASFIHLYFDTGRIQDVYFRSIAATERRSNGIAPKLAAALLKPERNRGLIALFDLSADLKQKTPLRLHHQHRNTATHRFLTTHTEMTPPSNEWIDRVRWHDLLEESLEQLCIARGAILYLARTIDAHEASKDHSSTTQTAQLPVRRVDTDLAEYE
jgi:hypothetical protein